MVTNVSCHIYCAGQTVPVGFPAELAPSRDGQVGRGQTLSGDLTVHSVTGDGVQAVSSVCLWLSLSFLPCEGKHWVRGFGGWLEHGLFTLRLAIV